MQTRNIKYPISRADYYLMSEYHTWNGDGVSRKILGDRLLLITLYCTLNELLGSLTRASGGLGLQHEKLCCLVLEEDFCCLIEECEAYLLRDLPEGSRTLPSFVSRSLTVIEESCALLKHGKVVPILAARVKKFEHHTH